MSKRKWIVAMVVVALIALFVPIVPATLSSGRILGVQYQHTAVVSPSYYAFRCGSYINSQVSAELVSGFTGLYQLSKGYTFSCVYSSA